jgi:hypothetical protein
MPRKDWYDDHISVNQSNRMVHRPTVQPARTSTAPITTTMSRGRADRRRASRFAVNDPAWLRVLDPLSMNRIEATIALGKVRHCSPAKGDFLAGILLIDICTTGPWRNVRGGTGRRCPTAKRIKSESKRY